MPTHQSFLRQVDLFADLSEPDLEKICQEAQVRSLAQGEILFTEGSLGQEAYIIQEGEIEIYKVLDGKRVHLAVRRPGEVIGEMALLEAAPRNASGQAQVDSLVVVIGHAQLDNLLNSSPAASRTMLHTIASRLRNTEILLRQSEKMAQLGTLMAGIAHELNNPSAAVIRGSKQLSSAFANLKIVDHEINAYRLPAGQLAGLDQRIQERAAHPFQLDSLTRSDREMEFEEWLTERGIEAAWKLAPPLADLFENTAELKSLAAAFPSASLPALAGWIAANIEVYTLLEEVNQGSGRISEIVKALKSYVYLDQAPVQEINLHEGLENTLVILRHKLKQGIEIIRDLDPSVPRILAFGSELNQVWTNLIDNAIDAMEGKGRLTIRTHFEESLVKVVIEDTGPGIPENIQAKLFSPFFTTKPLGKGTGLGLNITFNIIQKHKGDIQVTSRPGLTRFMVKLPVNFEQQT